MRRAAPMKKASLAPRMKLKGKQPLEELPWRDSSEGIGRFLRFNELTSHSLTEIKLLDHAGGTMGRGCRKYHT